MLLFNFCRLSIVGLRQHFQIKNEKSQENVSLNKLNYFIKISVLRRKARLSLHYIGWISEKLLTLTLFHIACVWIVRKIKSQWRWRRDSAAPCRVGVSRSIKQLFSKLFFSSPTKLAFDRIGNFIGTDTSARTFYDHAVILPVYQFNDSPKGCKSR